MKNFACWRATDAYSVINPDVDALPDYVFRAVHTDLPIHIRLTPDSPVRTAAAEAFLNEFLTRPKHALIPIIGESGTGKSHLIRWMKLRLPELNSRKVLFVPKAQTNLRDIVRMLISALPATEHETFEAALQAAGGAILTKEAQRTAILNNIHLFLVNDPGNASSGLKPDLEQFLIRGLVAIFSDPHLRGHLLRDGGFAADLAEHVYEKPESYQPAEARHVFTKADLPLEIGDIRRAAADTQEILTFLVSQPEATAQAATDIVNRHIDRAIAQSLNMTGDRLIELMLAIRRHLKKQNKILVLLIEDFARLQGLDNALLQILIEHARDDLCELRTAFACTTGFYRTLRDTVGTRLTSIVEMDVPLGSSENGIDLPRMVGRYLNALRLGSDELRRDWERHSQGAIGFEVKNHCDICHHREVCHHSFGQTADGHGLYPFTEKALNIMAHRAVPDADEKFNTRQFQKKVLLPIVNLQPEIEAGTFPPEELLLDLGGVKNLGPAERQRIEAKARQQAPRFRCLYELWDGSGQLRDLPHKIEEFFGLLPLGWEKQQEPGPEPDLPPRPAPQPETPGDPRLAEVDKWIQGQTILSANTAQKLRDLVSKSIEEFIDWDEIGLARSQFVGPASDFRPGSVYFDKQATSRVAHNVSITIPADWNNKQECFRTVMALQGILQADSDPDWSFDDGTEKLACLLECLEDWGAKVVEQLRYLDRANGNWDPAASAFELRCLAAVMTTPNLVVAEDAGLVRAALRAPESSIVFLTKSLADIATSLKNAERPLETAVWARYGALKGGALSPASENRFIGAAKLLKIASEFRSRNFVPNVPPEDSDIKTQPRKEIGKLARDVAKNLQKALQEEMKLRRDWRNAMEEAFGSNGVQQQIIAAAKEIGEAAVRLGISGSHELNSARIVFETLPYDEMLNAVKQLGEPGHDRVVDLAIDLSRTIPLSNALLASLKLVLNSAEAQVRGMLETGGVYPEEEKKLLAKFNDDLQQVRNLLEGTLNDHVTA